MMVQALIEQLVVLTDGLRDTTIRKYRKLCDSCGCHNEREFARATALAEERRPRACPLALSSALAADCKCQSRFQLASP
jgi:hypothetical protein